VHAQIGHNEPNQAASVHTIDNKPYISERRSADGDLYPGIAETRSVAWTVSVGCQLLPLSRRNDLEDRGKIGRDSTRALRACFIADL